MLCFLGITHRTHIIIRTIVYIRSAVAGSTIILVTVILLYVLITCLRAPTSSSCHSTSTPHRLTLGAYAYTHRAPSQLEGMKSRIEPAGAKEMWRKAKATGLGILTVYNNGLHEGVSYNGKVICRSQGYTVEGKTLG